VALLAASIAIVVAAAVGVWLLTRLRDSERRTRGILDASLDGIVTIDARGRVLEFNPAAERTFGYRRSDVLGREMAELIVPPALRDRHRKGLARFLATREARAIGRRVEFPACRADGSELLVELSIVEIPGNGLPAFTGYLRDITERKRTDEAIRLSEARHRSLIENAAYGIYRSTSDGRFLEVNPALVEMLGYASEEELLAVDLATAVYQDPSRRTELVERYASTGRIDGVEVGWKTRQGTPLTVRLSGRAVPDASGAAAEFEIMVENVTARRTLEEQLRRAQRLEVVGHLAAGVAHNFGNLLSVIIGTNELLRVGLPPDSTLIPQLALSTQATERAADLVKQLHIFSRQQEAPRNPSPLDLNEVIAQTLPLIRRLMGDRVEVRGGSSDGPALVEIDATQLQQVLLNLAVNARDAMTGGGTLTMAATADAHCVRLTVSDTGDGMDAATCARVFDPFFTTKEVGKGTGLGLAMVHGIVSQCGGRIRVDSEPGRGTTFVIDLPRKPAGDR